MKNTPSSISEASVLVSKLIDRTREKKLSWLESGAEGFAEAFESSLEGGISIVLSSSDSEIRLNVMIERDESYRKTKKTILEVALEHNPSFGYDLPGESELYERLFELNDLARRAALNVEQNLASAIDYLERLAG